MDENFEATTLLLKIILKRDDIEVTYVKGQEELKSNIYGGRTIRLDIRAKFADGTQTDIERYVKETGELVNDGSHIIYVNGKYRGDDDIGALMEDFSCKESKNMKFKELANGVRHFKETQEGREIMCESFERLANERAVQAANEKAKDMAKKLIVKGQMSVEEIADLTELPIDEVVELAGLQTV